MGQIITKRETKNEKLRIKREKKRKRERETGNGEMKERYK